MKRKTVKSQKLVRQPGEDDLDALMRMHRQEIPDFDRRLAKELASLRLGVKIAEARQAQNLTQRDLARLAGVTQPMIAKLERPTNTSATLQTLAAIATALGCSLVVDLAVNTKSSGRREPRRRARAA